MTIVLRNVKGSEITANEYDGTMATLFTKVTHGLAIGDAMRVDSGGDPWVKAQGDAAANVPDGVVVFVPDVDNAWIATREGTIFTWTAHGKGAAGVYLWIDQSTAGVTTASEPGSGVKFECLKIVDANTMMLKFRRFEVI